MGTDGQRGSSTTHPANMLQTLLRKREKLQNDLRNIETQVYELETSYLNEFRHFGNVWKGVEGSVSSSKKTVTNLKRSRKLQLEDRLFSLSSVTSPVAEELRTVHEDAASEFGLGRHNAGSGPINGAGKPKKGRTAIREAKRIRLPDEPDINGENDPSINELEVK